MVSPSRFFKRAKFDQKLAFMLIYINHQREIMKSLEKESSNLKPSHQSAIEALQHQLKKSHNESMKYFAKRSQAIAQLNAISSGAKLKSTTDRSTQYATLYETTATYESATYAIENALLTNHFAPADYSYVDMVNIPNQFKRAREIRQEIKPEIKQSEENNDEIIYCGE